MGAIPILPLPHRLVHVRWVAFQSNLTTFLTYFRPKISREISLLGLLFIAIGTGGIKPCVSSFGGDQFVLPEQSLQLQQFFSFFYFSINAGSMISTFLTPSLRNDVKCFGENSCFPLAFGVPAILMIISVGTSSRHLFKSLLRMIDLHSQLQKFLIALRRAANLHNNG